MLFLQTRCKPKHAHCGHRFIRRRARNLRVLHRLDSVRPKKAGSASWRTLTCLFALSLLNACTQTQYAAPPEQQPLPKTEINDSQQFDQETLYALIAAEIGLVRGRYELGLNNYVQQARDSQDVNIVARATQVARILKRHSESLEMAELWRTLDPGAYEARFVLVSEYVHAERFGEAFAEAQRLLEAGHTAGFDDIAIDATQKNAASLPDLYQRFKQQLSLYPNNTELLIGTSIIAQNQQELDYALPLVEKARKQAPESVRAAYQYFRVLNTLEREEDAAEAYSAIVDLQPQNKTARNAYARMLVQLDIDAALEQYQILLEQAPDDLGIRLNVALILLELDRYNEAEEHFLSLLKSNKHQAIANFGLGEIASVNENTHLALEFYRNVNDGRRFTQAVAKAANIIQSSSGLAEARAFIEQKRQRASDEDKVTLYLLEANALADHGELAESVSVLNAAITSHPESISLRYSRAMRFASAEKTSLAEQDFKIILEQAPENAATLNALGYTLLVQTDRIDEAGGYIRKALELEPDDAAILDSMGWYEFKKGNASRSIGYLKRAFEQYPDDEIAAHLGEVYWTMGRKSKAIKVWKAGLKENAESAHIKEAVERLGLEWPL